MRGANLIGRAIEVMSAVDAVADDFDTWEGVCGKDGQAAPVGSGSPTLRISQDHGGRHRCLTSAISCARRSRPPTAARPSRPTPRSRARPRRARSAARSKGSTFAESRGVGVRLIRDGRLGYAYAADPDARRGARRRSAARARTPRSPSPTSSTCCPTPRDVDADARAVPRGLGRRPDRPTRCRWRSTWSAAPDLERPARHEDRPGAGRRRGLAGGDRLHGRGRRRVRAHRRVVRRRRARRRGRRDPDRLLLPHRARRSTSSGCEDGRRRGGRSARSACWARRSRRPRRCRSMLDQFAAMSFLGVLAGALNAETVLKGRSLFADDGGPAGRARTCSRWSTTARSCDGPGACPFDDEGVPSGRTELFTARHAERVPARHLHGGAHRRRAALDRQREARRRTRARRAWAPRTSTSTPATTPFDELLPRAEGGVLIQDVSGRALGREPDQRRVQRRRDRAAHRRAARWASRCAR